MRRMVRSVVLVGLFVIALSVVLGIGHPGTGPFERAFLVGALLAVVALARPVHRIV